MRYFFLTISILLILMGLFFITTPLYVEDITFPMATVYFMLPFMGGLYCLIRVIQMWDDF